METPSPRVCQGSIIVGNSLIIFGGHTPSENNDYIASVYGDVWEFSFETHEWKEILSSQSVFTEANPVLYNNKVYIFGGFGNIRRHDFSVREFDLETKSLTILNTSEGESSSVTRRISRSAYAAAQHGNELFIFGGWNGFESFDDFYALNLEILQWREVKPSGANPPAVRYPNFVTYNEEFYIWGGFGKGVHPSEMYKYSFAENTWSIVPAKGSIPSGRSRSKAVVLENKMYMFGGWDRTNLLGDMYEFNFETLTWREISVSGIKNLCQHSMNVYNNLLIVFGGYNGQPQNSVYAMKLCNL